MLAVGTKLGPYEIIGSLGVGGMGEVYRARDGRLGRDVAIKVLPDLFAHDAERLTRFHREAQILAALNHSNIAHLYGLEESAEVPALVLELVEGLTLADRIGHRPLPLEEALRVARQIAEGLEAAHSRGLIHRDLKPANIKVRPDGQVKLLDFGLAKAFADESDALTPSQSPTRLSGQTVGGVILGTAAYMSPEQANGKKVDARADIWAFGCVMYEMLVGRPAFTGDTVTEILANVLKGQPDWSVLDTAPQNLRTILRRCLEKDPARRLRDIADVRLLLEDAVAVPAIDQTSVSGRAVASRRQVGRWIGATFGLVVVSALATALIVRWMTPRAPERVERFEVRGSQAEPFTTDPSGWLLAISPDGTRIVYQARRGDRSELAIRSLDQLEHRVIPGTAGAIMPVFSPDGSQLAFISSGKIRALSLAGGVVTAICDIRTQTGLSWISNDVLLFGEGGPSGGLFRVPAKGGQPDRIPQRDGNTRHDLHVFPDVLPDGRHVVSTVFPSEGTIDRARIEVRDIATGETKTLVEGASQPRYVPGYLVYARLPDTIMAVPFDLATLQVMGSPVPVQEGVVVKNRGAALYAVGRDGSLAYVPALAPTTGSFVWIDRAGRRTPALVEAFDRPAYPRLSPDARRFAVTMGAPVRNIWILTLDGAGQPLKVTFTGGNVPTWTPDGTRIVFHSAPAAGTSPASLFSIPADGTVLDATHVAASKRFQVPGAWSPDAQWLLFAEETGYAAADSTTGSDLMLFRARDQTSQSWLQTAFDESQGSFSPDGYWVAYVSNSSGRAEVWVRPFPGPGAPARVSAGGGQEPVWSRDGKELFFLNGRRMMAVQVDARQADFRHAAPRTLFERDFAVTRPRSYDVAPDGRFLMIERGPAPTNASFVLVKNWVEELKQRVARK